MEIHQFDELNILQELTLLKEQIDSYRPLDPETEARVFQKFKLDWNYHSNAIEGNSLDYGETRAFLMHGVTAKGKPLKDHLDIRGHNEAIEFLMDFIKHKEELTEKDIRALHKTILAEPYEIQAVTPSGLPTNKMVKLGEYKSSPNHVKTATGEIHFYTSPEETPIKMNELMDWFNQVSIDQTVHPLVIAAIFHHKFVEIHPFDDGNGRLARILMNLILMRAEYPPAVIKKDSRELYYSTLSQADAGNYTPLIEYIGDTLIHSCNIYISGAKGEDINELDDLDKRIALFKKELDGSKEKIEKKRSLEVQIELFNNVAKPLYLECDILLNKFKEMFLTYELATLNHDDNANDDVWSYYSYKDINETIETLYQYFSYNDTFDQTVLVFQLNEFRFDDNPFGVEVKIIVKLLDYKYRVSYIISDYNDVIGQSPYEIGLGKRAYSIENYYGNLINESDIKRFCSKFGDDLLIYIQNTYSNRNFYVVTEEEVKDAWEDFLKHTELKEIVAHSEELHVSLHDKIISISSDNLSLIKTTDENKFLILEEIQKILKYKNSLGIRTDYTGTPEDDNLPF